MSNAIDVPANTPAAPAQAGEPETPVQARNDVALQKHADGSLTPPEALAAMDDMATEIQTMRMARVRELHALNRGSQCELDLSAANSALQLYQVREPLVQALLSAVASDAFAAASTRDAAAAVQAASVTP